VVTAQASEQWSGTYALLLRCSVSHRLEIGRLGALTTRRGVYVYVGSAFGPGGLSARVGHHRGMSSRPHWHVDYLRSVAEPEGCWYTLDPRFREHEWAAVLGGLPGASIPMPRFGSSDCSCASHLFYFPSPPSVWTFRRRLAVRCPGHQKVRAERVPTLGPLQEVDQESSSGFIRKP
jgi:Uri superfamily endonuclease